MKLAMVQMLSRWGHQFSPPPMYERCEVKIAMVADQVVQGAVVWLSLMLQLMITSMMKCINSITNCTIVLEIPPSLKSGGLQINKQTIQNQSLIHLRNT